MMDCTFKQPFGSTHRQFYPVLGVFFCVVVAAGITAATPMSARGQGPADFLSRLDANGNGMIDPEESQGRMGFFLQRMAENNPRIDLSKPIPLATITAEFERMRQQGGPFGGSSRGGSSRSDRGDSSSRGDRRSREQENPYSSRVTSVEPLVPGFGIEDVMTPAAGFGAEAELFNVEVNDRDRQEAARAYRYYDRNQDGVIDAEEMKRSRYGADLQLYDRNRDGKITLNEMEYRYARRRIESERDRGTQTASRSSSSSSSSSSSASPGGPGGGMFQRGGGFTRGGPGGGGFSRGGPGGDNARSSNQRNDEKERARKKDDRTSYRIASTLERLPAGLPDWFTRDDANGDGQVSMSEFSTAWTEAVFDDFNQFDLNRDGIVTPSECLQAVEAGAVRGSKVAASSSTDRGSFGRSSSNYGSGSAESRPDQSAGSSEEASAGDVDPRTLAYASRLIGQYDANGDGYLTPSEWEKMSKNPAAADRDGDGKVSAKEYAIWISR